jgi:uncharacterized membrane protein (DUF106 family)
MRVVHINKSDVKGGAAVAASRIVSSLRGMEVEASMLVAEKLGQEDWSVSIGNSRREKAKVMFYFLQEVAAFLPHEKSKTSRLLEGATMRVIVRAIKKPVVIVRLFRMHPITIYLLCSMAKSSWLTPTLLCP